MAQDVSRLDAQMAALQRSINEMETVLLEHVRDHATGQFRDPREIKKLAEEDTSNGIFFREGRFIIKLPARMAVLIYLGVGIVGSSTVFDILDVLGRFFSG